MSGHSKWSTIKRKKGALDAKRGKVFTKIIKEITVAARLGGGDDSANPRLRKAIADARTANMPQDNIQRAIQKGTGELPGVSYEEGTYEGYGPGGVAILMEVITDNKNRIVAEIRHIMSKYGGNLGDTGSVSWMFDRKGQIAISRENLDEDSLLEAILEAGGEDFETEEDVYLVTTDVADLLSVRESLESKGFQVLSAEVEMIPANFQKVEGKDASSLMKLMEALEDNDDINNVYSNFDIDENDLSSDMG